MPTTRNPVSGNKKRYAVTSPGEGEMVACHCDAGYKDRSNGVLCGACNGTGVKFRKGFAWRYYTDNEAAEMRELGYTLEQK